MPEITIHGRKIGSGHPVYIVAEMSANHHQNFEEAVRIVHAAKEAGADAVKLQTYTPDTLTIDCDDNWFRIGGGTIWEGQRLYDLYAQACTPWEWHEALSQIAAALELDLFSTPFDETAVDFLEEQASPAYKIASFECVDLPLIRRIARTGKPIILSTGMASETEISDALDTISAAGGSEVALLKCTSAYPSPPEAMNLRTIPDLAARFRVPAGLSDHTLGTTVPTAAVALGACIVEKHLTLSRERPGPDSQFSLEPAEFRAMADAIRSTEKALGAVSYGASEAEKSSMVFRRSLFVVRDVRLGEAFTSENVRSIRPGYGLAPRYYDDVIGQHAACDIARGTPLKRAHLYSATRAGADGKTQESH
jgi:pseudaminic acid synthase